MSSGFFCWRILCCVHRNIQDPGYWSGHNVILWKAIVGKRMNHFTHSASGKRLSRRDLILVFIRGYYSESMRYGTGWPSSGCSQDLETIKYVYFIFQFLTFWGISWSRIPNMKLFASGLGRNSKIKSREVIVFFSFLRFLLFFRIAGANNNDRTRNVKSIASGLN